MREILNSATFFPLTALPRNDWITKITNYFLSLIYVLQPTDNALDHFIHIVILCTMLTQ